MFCDNMPKFKKKYEKNAPHKYVNTGQYSIWE